MSAMSCCQCPVATLSTSTLIDLSDTWDTTPPRCCKTNDVLSPWKCDRQSVVKEASRAHRTGKTKKDNSRQHSPSWLSAGRVENEAVQTALRKNARFRGALTTVLSAERRQPVEEGFQHLEHVEQYIEQYRATRHALLHRPLNQTNSDTHNKTAHELSASSTSLTAKKERHQAAGGCDLFNGNPPRHSSDKARQLESTSATGRHMSRGVVFRTSQSEMTSPGVCHVSSSTVKMAVTGSQMGGNKNKVYGERGRRRIQWGDNSRRRQRAPCRKLYLTWRQYRKYFLVPTSSTCVTQEEASDQSEAREEEGGGYVERSTTPAPTMPCRATTCVAVLDYDQSRVATPTSPFQLDQSARQKQTKSAVFPTVGKPGERERTRRPQTDGGVKGRRSDKGQHGDVTRPGLVGRSRSDLVGEGRPRLTICTAVDIQEAVKDLALSLGNKKPLTKTVGSP
ncbi:hypothetical protein BaRGS_00025347 [Batillaria attramentaria]|uniref:Uncharacterized protein n=1 Tax=Batillaria attramentaria TaxID=370345 RepID=A0ABD0K8M4_9CAEN